VVSPDRHSVVGWITSHDVIHALSRRLAAFSQEAVQGNLAAEWARDDAAAAVHTPPSPLVGYELVEIAVTERSSIRNQQAAEISWPSNTVPVAVTRRRRTLDPGTVLRPGDHVIVIAPRPTPSGAPPQPDEAVWW
jgi:Trk K+ transport system NAD-binding subunit